MNLGGTCGDRFDTVRELFAAKLELGEDLGAALVVNIDGEAVVDLWGGWADLAGTVPWTENTITKPVLTGESPVVQNAFNSPCYLERE
jgi:hypothetical protein